MTEADFPHLEAFFRRHNWDHQFTLVGDRLFYYPWCLFQTATIAIEQGNDPPFCCHCTPTKWWQWEQLIVQGTLLGGRAVTIVYQFRRYGPLLERCWFSLQQVSLHHIEIQSKGDGTVSTDTHQRLFRNQQYHQEKRWRRVTSSPRTPPKELRSHWTLISSAAEPLAWDPRGAQLHWRTKSSPTCYSA